jgi:hypothetical protein
LQTDEKQDFEDGLLSLWHLAGGTGRRERIRSRQDHGASPVLVGQPKIKKNRLGRGFSSQFIETVSASDN